MRGADDNAVHHDQQYFSFTQNRNNLHDCSTITLSIFHIEQFAPNFFRILQTKSH